ncbi:hypothetical protein K320107C7_26060 [Alistipes shahii]
MKKARLESRAFLHMEGGGKWHYENALHPESRLLAVRARNRGAAFRPTGRFANPAFWPCGRGAGEQRSGQPAALPIPPFGRAGAEPGEQRSGQKAAP